ncbi:hypothetical protein QUA00_19140 [Microcoleus sp. T2B6]|uniref:hypothetical protein n=1 Tax=Microcoleus sp. T2B6 TaxID=3055424 RepID=UPI002FD78B7B
MEPGVRSQESGGKKKKEEEEGRRKEEEGRSHNKCFYKYEMLPTPLTTKAKYPAWKLINTGLKSSKPRTLQKKVRGLKITY